MRRRAISNAKFIITVEGNKKSRKINTISIYDNRINEYLSDDYIHERGIKWFLNVDDMKETLNWNLNGDSSKYQFKWRQSGKDVSEGKAYVFQ